MRFHLLIFFSLHCISIVLFEHGSQFRASCVSTVQCVLRSREFSIRRVEDKKGERECELVWCAYGVCMCLKGEIICFSLE